MSKKMVLIILLTSVVLLLATESSTTYAALPAETPFPPEETKPAQPAGVTEETATLAPPLSLFINIMVDDVDNYNPAVAYNSIHDEYLVVFENDRGATRDIYAQRVAGDGTLKSWFSIASYANHCNYLADVVYNPLQDEYLIVYTYQVNTSDYDIYARRVKWNGADLDQTAYQEFPINLDSGIQWYPSVAFNIQNNEYLVVYENYWSSTLRDIDAQRVQAIDGQLLGPASGYNVATGANTIRRLPDVAYNEARNEYLIAYTYQDLADGDIYGKIASNNFGTLSSEIYIVNNTNDQDSVALAAGPDEYLAVWNDGGNTTIYGRRVTGTGALQPYIPFVNIAGQMHVEPAVAFGNVYGYLVSWRYANSGVTGDDIYGRFVKPGQDLPWGSQFPIDIGSDSQRSPALACGFFGDCLVVEEDNWSGVEYEIRGRFVLTKRINLPVIVR